MRRLKSLVLVLAMVIAGVLAALSVNQEEIGLTYAIWRTPIELSIFWWLLITFVIGVTFGWLSALWVSIKRRLENRKLRQSLAQANAEVERLRDVTLQG